MLEKIISLLSEKSKEGAVNNFMDKIRGELVKNLCFHDARGIKTVSCRDEGGSKNTKFCPHSYE